jgi:hypothetical protein
MEHDLAWAQGGVQQVWGLGVPLWRLGFEVVWRLLGQRNFPEMLAFGFALWFAVWTVVRALFDGPCQAFLPEMSPVAGTTEVAHRWGRDLSHLLWFATAAALLVLFPPFITLLRSRFLIYEEVVAYEYLFGLVLIGNLLQLETSGSVQRFWWLCGLAGLGGLLRPTLLFHGGAILIAATGVLWRKRKANGLHRTSSFSRERALAGGFLLFVAGGVLLFTTNLARFGHGFEFGHRLNVQNFYGSLYATRFDDPYRNEPILSAGRELFGLLFLTKEFSMGDFYLENFFAGQSQTLRWRETYLTVYDPSFFALLVVGAGCGLACLQKVRRSDRMPIGSAAAEHARRYAAALAVYGLVASVALLGFYLRNAVISSRYLLDLMPSFAALLLSGWLAWGGYWLARTRLRWLLGGSCCVLVAWLTWEISQGSSAYGPPWLLIAKEIQDQKSRPNAMPQLAPMNAYESPRAPVATKIPYNGAGWETNGMAMPCVILFVESPHFLELEVAPTTNTVHETDLHHFRAKVGLEFLARETVQGTERGWLVRFAGPKRREYQTGIQPVFVATVPNTHLADRETPWRLLSVRWRSDSEDTQHE